MHKTQIKWIVHAFEEGIRWLVVESSSEGKQPEGKKIGNVWFIKEAADIHQKVAYKYI